MKTRRKLETERDLLRYFRDLARKYDILTYRFSSPSMRGVPDLIVVGRGGKVGFVELKSPQKTGKLSKLQVLTIELLRLYGCRVDVIDSEEGVYATIAAYSVDG